MTTEFGTALAQGVSMNYFKFGTGAKTLVIIPGLSVTRVSGSAEAVAAEYGLMTDDFTLYVFERREEPPKDYPVRDMALDTMHVIESLGLCDIYLFGASQGGMISSYIAAHSNGLVKKLALCSTAAKIDPSRMKTIDSWIELAKCGDALGLFADFCEKVYPESIFKMFEPAIADAAAKVTPQDLERFAIFAEGTRSFDISRDAGLISCPVFAAGASDDRVLGGDAICEITELFAGVPGFESVIYDGFGHAAYDTAPDFRKKLYAFFMK